MDWAERLAEYLESYSSRDKLMRIVYYSAQFVGGCTSSSETRNKLNIFSDQVNSCRTVLRLFDDIPMLHYTLSYGLGRQELDTFVAYCGVTANLLDQLYYPIEHIAWAADCKLLPFSSDKWWTASSVCWALSMYVMTLKSLRQYMQIQHIKRSIAKRNMPRDNFRVLSAMQNQEILTAVRCLLDFVHAVHWLPKGFLWGGKLRQWHVGALGILSSLISLCQT